MIGVTVAVESVNAARALHRIYTKDIKDAQKAALVRAAETTISKAATRIASEFNVPKWMVLGKGGAKNSRGGRLAKSAPFHRQGWSIAVYLRKTHLNPAGTAVKVMPGLRALKDGRVRAGKYSYDNAFIQDSGFGGKYIRVRNGSKAPYAKIEIDGDGSAGASGKRASRILAGANAVYGMETFKKRFAHELKRRADGTIKGYRRR